MYELCPINDNKQKSKKRPHSQNYVKIMAFRKPLLSNTEDTYSLLGVVVFIWNASYKVVTNA